MTARPHAPRSLPACYPPHGTWPWEMPAEVTAAFFGIETTGKLFKAIERNEAPRPTSSRLRDGRRIPVWHLEACRRFLDNRHQIRSDAPVGIRSIAGRV